jgi:hypothetical protein
LSGEKKKKEKKKKKKKRRREKHVGTKVEVNTVARKALSAAFVHSDDK